MRLTGLPAYGDSAWNGKPAAIMGASIGTIGTARAQDHLCQIMVFLNMFPVNQPEVMIGNASARFDANGNLTDEATKEVIRKLLQSLVDWTIAANGPTNCNRTCAGLMTLLSATVISTIRSFLPMAHNMLTGDEE
jgi:NAD(P)H-dependent FMN reductase